MNQGFYTLSENRQAKIINAGFRIFAENTYRKAPVGDVAKEAGISKSLLFYHFKNKKEFYLFLWKKSLELTAEQVQKYKVWDTDDYFDMLRRSLKGKCHMLKKYPYAMEFAMRAYYEQDLEVKGEVGVSFGKENERIEEKVLAQMNKSRFREELDFTYLYKEMTWAVDGYMRQMIGTGNLDAQEMESQISRLIEFWEKVYLK